MPEITHDQFIRAIAEFEGPTFAATSTDRISRDDWIAHFHACRPCSDAVLAHRLAQRGVNAGDYACLHLAYRATETCEQHPDRAECHDLIIAYNEKFDEYSIVKGQCNFTIQYCPWCGAALPPSQRDRWFDELEALGIDPWTDDVPERYRTSAWFKPALRRARS